MIELDAEKLLENALRDGLRDGVKAKLSSSYNNPFEKMIEDSIKKQEPELRSILDDALSSCLKDKDFRSSVAESVRGVMARTLVQRFGGELEKQVNVLKSDPATRARITLAIEEIVKQKTS